MFATFSAAYQAIYDATVDFDLSSNAHESIRNTIARCGDFVYRYYPEDDEVRIPSFAISLSQAAQDLEELGFEGLGSVISDLEEMIDC